MTACIFCSTPDPVSKEHIIPVWIWDLIKRENLPHSKVALFTETDHNHSEISRVLLTSDEATCPILCFKCNHDWGGKNQSKSSPILTPFIKGGWYLPNTEQIIKINRWYAINLFVNEFIHDNHETHRQEEREKFKKIGFFPNSLHVWMAALPKPDLDSIHRSIIFPDSIYNQGLNGHIRILVIGYLIFVSFGIPPDIKRTDGYKKFTELQDNLSRNGFIQIRDSDRKFKVSFPHTKSVFSSYDGVTGLCDLVMTTYLK